MPGPNNTASTGLAVVTSAGSGSSIGRVGLQVVTEQLQIAPHNYPSVGIATVNAVSGPKFIGRAGVQVVTAPLTNIDWYAYTRIVSSMN